MTQRVEVEGVGNIHTPSLPWQNIGQAIFDRVNRFCVRCRSVRDVLIKFIHESYKTRDGLAHL